MSGQDGFEGRRHSKRSNLTISRRVIPLKIRSVGSVVDES